MNEVTGLQSQIGGHFGLFSCNGHVLKPLNTRELHFYKQMDERLLPFTVKYCGQISIRVNLSEVEEGLLRLSTDSSVPTVSDIQGGIVSETMVEGSEEEDEEDATPMTFKVSKGGKVEAAGNVYNTFAEKCQSKVRKSTQNFIRHIL